MIRRSGVALGAAVVLTAVAGVAIARARPMPEAASEPVSEANPMILGAEVFVGTGTVSSFARVDATGAPLAIGVVFAPETLDGLPGELTDSHRCHDHDGDGAMAETECLPTHERVIPLPPEVSRRADVPFDWVLFNWNPIGHAPTDIYGAPHFDIHYFIDSIENTFALIPGPCGPEWIRCDQFERARKPVPSNFMHADFQNVDAAAPAMGNHLIDLTSHEFHGSAFDRTWIYGAFDGRVTFYEEMVTLAYLRTRPETCFPIKVAPAFELAGYYPTQSCFRFDGVSNLQMHTIEGFVMREASPAEF